MKYTKKLHNEINLLPPCFQHGQGLCGAWTVVDVLSGHWKIKFVYRKCHSRGEILSGVTCFCPHSVVSQKTLVNTHMQRTPPCRSTFRRFLFLSLIHTHAHTISSVYDTENYNTTTTAPKLIYWNVDLERPQRENNKHYNLQRQLNLHVLDANRTQV